MQFTTGYKTNPQAMVGQLVQLHAEAVDPPRRGGAGDSEEPGEGEPLPAGHGRQLGARRPVRPDARLPGRPQEPGTLFNAVVRFHGNDVRTQNTDF